MARKYFGTDGVRGRVGTFPITPEFVLRLGWAAGMAFRQEGRRGRILVGKDTRMPDYLILVSTLGGLAVFGLNGFVIGPLIAALFISSWGIFAATKPQVQLPQ